MHEERNFLIGDVYKKALAARFRDKMPRYLA
jgi:hypothetical protein